MTKYVGAIDQGTTSTRFIVFDRAGGLVARAQKEHRQIFPQPGWVEHDPEEIFRATCAVISEALAGAGLSASDIAAVGIANQRETALIWERDTGRPLHNAIVWMDARTEAMVANMAREGGPDRFRDRTGLPLATYFSALKWRWLLDHLPDVHRRAEAGEVLFGTIDAWLAWRLTGLHVTDITNASRTQLMNLATLDWDESLLAAFGLPRAGLPEIQASSEILGAMRAPLEGVPLASLLGDQQAALFGQACLRPGQAKNTYGTGCFLLMNTGERPFPSKAGLLTTLGYQIGEAKPVYALEGSVAIAGALVQWLRDNLGLIGAASEIEALAAGAPDNGDVYIVPAFSGLYAPYWRAGARGIIAGLTRFADKRHIARAALEATAYQTRDVLDAMTGESGVAMQELRVDGGMVVNNLLMQFQSDLLGVPVVRPKTIETTALGAAYAAGLAVGYWRSTDDIEENWAADRRWAPAMDESLREKLYASWGKAVRRSFDWVE